MVAVIGVRSFRTRCPHAFIRHNHSFCTIFRSNFNIMSALSAHQLLTLPQKIDSRDGLF